MSTKKAKKNGTRAATTPATQFHRTYKAWVPLRDALAERKRVSGKERAKEERLHRAFLKASRAYHPVLVAKRAAKAANADARKPAMRAERGSKKGKAAWPTPGGAEIDVAVAAMPAGKAAADKRIRDPRAAGIADALRALGGTYYADEKAWEMPDAASADLARAVLARIHVKAGGITMTLEQATAMLSELQLAVGA